MPNNGGYETTPEEEWNFVVNLDLAKTTLAGAAAQNSTSTILRTGRRNMAAMRGKADGTRGKGKGVVRAATPASALRSTQDNTVLVADVLQRLAVQGTRISTFRWIL